MGAPLHGLHLPRHLEDLVQRVPVELLRLDHVAQARGDLVLLRRGGGAGGDGGGSAAAQARRGGGGREGQTGAAAAGGGREGEVGPREGGASGGGHGRGEARRRVVGREGLGFRRSAVFRGSRERHCGRRRDRGSSHFRFCLPFFFFFCWAL